MASSTARTTSFGEYFPQAPLLLPPRGPFLASYGSEVSVASAAALGTTFGEGSQVPPAPASSPAGALGAWDAALLASWKLWVRAWLHVPGKKRSEPASAQKPLQAWREAAQPRVSVASAPVFLSARSSPATAFLGPPGLLALQAELRSRG